MPRLARTKEIDVELLRVFVSVCEHRSLTKAAQHLGVTQAAMSQRMLQLERLGGTALFDRAIRPIQLTPSGQQLFIRARQVLAALRLLEVDLARGATVPLPTFGVGVTGSLGTSILPDLAPRLQVFSKRLLMRVDTTAVLSAALMNRSLDVIVSNDPLEEAEELLERFEVFREPLVLACPSDEPLPSKDVYANVKWLSENRPLIRLSEVSPLARQIETLLLQMGLSPPRVLEFNSGDAIVQMVQDGLGWTITTPSNLTLSNHDRSRIWMRKLTRGAVSRSTWLVARSGELGDVTTEVAGMVVRALAERVVPRIAAELPWVIGDIKVASSASLARSQRRVSPNGAPFFPLRTKT